MPTANTDKNDRVLFIMFQDPDHEIFEYLSFFKYLVMWMNCTLLKYGTCDGMIIVVDSKGLNWHHIVKLPIGIAGKMLKFLQVSRNLNNSLYNNNNGNYINIILSIVVQTYNYIIFKFETYL